jgi:hypothetical protein
MTWNGRQVPVTVAAMLFLTRGQPLLQIAIGVACVVTGLFVLTRILLSVGGLLIVWGAASWILRWRDRSRDASADRTPGR